MYNVKYCCSKYIKSFVIWLINCVSFVINLNFCMTFIRNGILSTSNAVPRFTGKTPITGKTAEIPERLKSNRGNIDIVDITGSRHYKIKILKSLFQNYK